MLAGSLSGGGFLRLVRYSQVMGVKNRGFIAVDETVTCLGGPIYGLPGMLKMVMLYLYRCLGVGVWVNA